MIEAIVNNLFRGVKLLESMSDETYSDTSIAPYYSSIGVHMRHVLDVFECIFDGIEMGKVDLSARKRMELAELKTEDGIAYFQKIITNLYAVQSDKFDQLILVSDDLGQGVVTVKYTIASALAQAHSHAIHHFASIGYIIAQLDIELPDNDFGYNPTTPRNAKTKSNK